jgi:hypothetical protein
MKQRITSTKQLKRSAFWLLLSAFVGYYALKNQLIDLNKVYDSFLTFNSILMGFVITALTITGSTLGTPLVKELQKNGSYYSLITNFYWLFILLFINTIFGFIFLLSKITAHWFIDFLVLIDITLLLILFWYAISRLVRLVRALK